MKESILALLVWTSFASFGSSFCAARYRKEKLSISLHSSNPQVRDWRTGEGREILDLLQSAEDGSFNPEGGLDLDCQSESLLKESYDLEDGGCFVVAEMDDAIVGVAGLIVGTPVEYQSSGASVSSAETTAAIRRCCCRLPSSATTASTSSSSVLTKLLKTLEERAVQAEATQLIALAYPPTSISTTIRTEKPSPQLLQQLGYQVLPQQLPGVDVVQFGKSLQGAEVGKEKDTADDADATNAVGAIIAIGALGILLAGFYAVAQFIGFDTTVASTLQTPEMDSINRGLGRPLSSEDLGQLMRDEQLKRKTLDGDGNLATSRSTDGREWKDLSLEEQREEMALLQIINGQDVRIK